MQAQMIELIAQLAILATKDVIIPIIRALHPSASDLEVHKNANEVHKYIDEKEVKSNA